MDKTVLVATVPLMLGIIVYIFQAAGYQFMLNRPGMALQFTGYVLANIGLLWDALSVGVK